METIEKLLRSELEEELEALSEAELGSDDYKVAVEGITKLMDRQIEISKLNTEYELKRDAREIDTDLKVQQMKADAKDRKIKYAISIGETVVSTAVIIWGTLKSFKFEENGTITGTPDLYCTPHLLNVMLLARDLNGRRIYDSKADLAAALNVASIQTVEQFEGLERTSSDGKKKLLGLFVNLADYQFGSTRGGEVTKFEDFDMDFNRYKYMLETSNRWKRQNSGEINDNLNLANVLSILADPFAFENHSYIAYVDILGTKWKVTDVELQYPRMILSIGGIWNEDTPGATE